MGKKTSAKYQHFLYSDYKQSEVGCKSDYFTSISDLNNAIFRLELDTKYHIFTIPDEISWFREIF